MKSDELEKKIKGHLKVLDGWRGIAILAVLAAHMFPIGPKSLDLNESAGLFGMAVFFILSGFLITTTLINRPRVIEFIIRRFTRIIPLAWLYMVIALVYISASIENYLPSFLFYANMPPFWLTGTTGHIWSLCVEMQFYIFIALIFLFFRKKGLKFLIVICIGITILRIWTKSDVSIITYYRVDEILAGAILALIYKNELGENIKKIFKYNNLYLMIILLCFSCHKSFYYLNFFRPYFAMLVVGITLFKNKENSKIEKLLENKFLTYTATVSYALYILHPLLINSWFGSGSKLIVYAKRPVLIATLFIISHVSTFYYEKFWIEKGKNLIKKIDTIIAKDRIYNKESTKSKL